MMKEKQLCMFSSDWGTSYNTRHTECYAFFSSSLHLEFRRGKISKKNKTRPLVLLQGPQNLKPLRLPACLSYDVSVLLKPGETVTQTPKTPEAINLRFTRISRHAKSCPCNWEIL